MGYMTVLQKTESRLTLLREPTFFSKAAYVGFVVGVVGIFIFGSESFIFKALIGLIAFFMSCFIVDNYEICDINLTTSEVKLTHRHWFLHLLTKLDILSSTPYVTIKVEDIQDVRVTEQDAGQDTKAYQVAFVLDTGITIGITEVFTTDKISEHQATADMIRNLLSTRKLPIVEDDVDYEGDGSSSDVEDDDDRDGFGDGFELISKADLEGAEEEQVYDASQSAQPGSNAKLEAETGAAAAGSLPSPSETGDDARNNGQQENAASC